MESQICCSNKLLLAMDLKPAKIPADRVGLPPLSTWYADVFNFNRRKCLVFYNPATGYGMVAAYVTKKRLTNLALELLRTYEVALNDDGVSPERVRELLTAVANPVICRTSDRKARAHLMHDIRDAESSMLRSDKSDPDALERAAHLIISHGMRGPTWNPIKAFSDIIGEPLENRLIRRLWHVDMCQVLVTLQGVDPPIWRRILIPSQFKLDRSHLVIQGAFGWTHSHSHIFRAGGRAFEAIYDKLEEYEGEDETQIAFYDFLMMGAGTAEYVYDFGDDWRHTIQLEERILSEKPSMPHCVAGERACPPEDVGGTSGYDQMLKILADPTDEEYESIIDWLPENFDPETFSVDSADRRIQHMLF